MSLRVVQIPVEGQKMWAQLHMPDTEQHRLGALLVHGWRGRRNDRAAKFLAEQGYPSLTISLRGHKGSEGDIRRISRQDSLADVRAGYDFLNRQLPVGTPKVGIGHSYGGYLLPILSSEETSAGVIARPLAGLSLRAPAAYPNQGFKEPQWGRGHEDEGVWEWRQKVHEPGDNYGFAGMQAFTRQPGKQVQIIESGRDRLVPHASVESYRRAIDPSTPADYRLMRSWPHRIENDSEMNRLHNEMLLEFMGAVELTGIIEQC